MNKSIIDEKFSKKKRISFSLIAIFISISIILIFSEIVLRVFPIPGIRYNVSTYDSLTGSAFYPNSIDFYRSNRGDFVKRKINKWGYYDKNYKRKKEDGYNRIGFFGDSYTQAVQVPLQETFHYIIGDSLKKLKFETLSFGHKGFSTYQSYLTYTKWADFFDLDLIVYVFCENDLGDNIEIVKKWPEIAYPLIKDNRLIIDDSFKETRKNRTRYYYKFIDYLTSKFLIFATISERLQLLFQFGINVTNEERFMNSIQNIQNEIIYPPYLGPEDYPSLWPDSLRILATDLGEIILLKWKKQIEMKQKSFVVLYTPKYVNKPTLEQESWKPWLKEFCLQNKIPFIDPTTNLLNMELNGNEVHYDHYTKFGHQAVSETFINWFLINYKPKQKMHIDN